MLKLLASSIVLLQLACLSYGIHNGLVSNARDFPFFVNLQLAGTNKFCGGTLISDKWVLTAAHCLVFKQTIIAHLGLDNNGTSLQQYTVEASNQHPHGWYSNQTAPDFDIALVELPQKIVPSPYIKPVYLATDSIPHQGNEQVTLIGRGATDPEGDVKYDKIWDRRIRQAEFTTIPIDKCMTDAQFHPGHPNMAVCAPRHNGVVLGSGDSGSPLIRKRDGALIGVTSWRIYAQAPTDTPSHMIFTSVPYFFDLISKVTGLATPK